MDIKQRLEYVDIFRGIALLIMVVIQIFDYLSVSSIYTTPPYYVETINSVTWVPPSLLFTFVSGMSVFLLVKKKLYADGTSPKSPFLDVFKRYGKYVLISLPFTLIMWNVGTYFGWEEAIQGIGLTAIFTALFLIIFLKYVPKINSRRGYISLIFLILAFGLLQSMIPRLIDNSFLGTIFPRQPSGVGFLSILGGLIFNAFFRGWFSIANLFPIMIGGVILISLINESNISNKKLIILSATPLLFSILLHSLGYNINYYERSFALTPFAIGQSALICSITYVIYKNSTRKCLSRTLNFLKVFGATAFFVYIFHYLVILKVLEVTSLKDLLPDLYSWMITLPLVVLVYFAARYYLRIKEKLPDFLRV